MYTNKQKAMIQQGIDDGKLHFISKEATINGFRYYVDSLYEKYEIFGRTYTPSQILEKVSPESFEQGLNRHWGLCTIDTIPWKDGFLNESLVLNIISESEE